MIHRKTDCDACESDIVITNTRFVQRNIIVEKEYSETCGECGNLLYGFIKEVPHV